MEVGECSSGSNSSSNEIWAKLVPTDSRYSDVEIRSTEMVICSEITASPEKHEWCKITRNSDQSSAIMQNKSVQNEDSIVINCESKIIPGPDREGYLSYRFKLMPGESCMRRLKVFIDAVHAKCSICLKVWHDVVTVAPCLHNFRNGRFSEWWRRSQEKHASIKSNLLIQTGKKLNRKKGRPNSDVENEAAQLPCPQCGAEFNNFRCNQNTIHLQCQACGGMVPSRANIGVPQHCLGCDKSILWCILASSRGFEK